jgi:hypothetical protein
MPQWVGLPQTDGEVQKFYDLDSLDKSFQVAQIQLSIIPKPPTIYVSLSSSSVFHLEKYGIGKKADNCILTMTRTKGNIEFWNSSKKQ